MGIPTHGRMGREFMKKYTQNITGLLLISAGLSACGSTSEKAAALSLIYGLSAVLSLLLLIGCFRLVQQNRRWFLLLFSSVLVVNIGYTLLALSTGLEMALHANRLSYLGSVFLPLAMLMIIINVTSANQPKWLAPSLFILSAAVFLVAASPGILDIYYKEVSFQIINGTGTLVKVYGPLHPIYLFYLLGYFGAMVVVIFRASIRKTIGSAAHAVILATAVLVNIGVWLIEQVSDIDFEFLSVSYIISELFLLGAHMAMRENQRLRTMLQQKEEALQASAAAKQALPADQIPADTMAVFIQGLETLTPTEQAILDAYLAGMSTKEIMDALNIKENTLKFHNKNLYGKLGVSSRKELLRLHKHLRSAYPQGSNGMPLT